MCEMWSMLLVWISERLIIRIIIYHSHLPINLNQLIPLIVLSSLLVKILIKCLYFIFLSVGIKYGLTTFSQKLLKPSNVISNVLTLPSFVKSLLCAFRCMCARLCTFAKRRGCFCWEIFASVFWTQLERSSIYKMKTYKLFYFCTIQT